MQKPFSAAADRNKDPILNVLIEYLLPNKRLLEIGSGTGQHAVYMAKHLPFLQWTTSDQKINHIGIQMWLEDAKLPNVDGPESFKVGEDKVPGTGRYDYIYSANTLHIMPWSECELLFDHLPECIDREGLVFFYGPYKYDGEYTSESNEAFDRSLQSQNPLSGIRNFEDIKDALESRGFSLVRDHQMPANNQLLVFCANQTM